MLALSLSHLSMRVRVRGQLSFIPCVCVCVRVNALARTSALTHWYFLFSPLLRSMFVAIVLAVNSLKYVIHTHTRIQRRNQQQYKRNGMVFARSHIWWVLYGTGKCVCVCCFFFHVCVLPCKRVLLVCFGWESSQVSRFICEYVFVYMYRNWDAYAFTFACTIFQSFV